MSTRVERCKDLEREITDYRKTYFKSPDRDDSSEIWLFREPMQMFP